MNIPGERFTLDLSDEAGVDAAMRVQPRSPAFVADVTERQTRAPQPPSAPVMKTATGFPEHKKRLRTSTFKQQRAASRRGDEETTVTPSATAQPTASAGIDDERRAIDEENTRRLASMSAAEIEQEQHELMNGLSPSLIQRLLKRANLDEGRGDTGIDLPDAAPPPLDTPLTPDTVAPRPSNKRQASDVKTVRFADDDEPIEPIDLQPAAEETRPGVERSTIHFPTADAPPELDPADPDFLQHLHDKYFPSLPVDPSKLAWMAPVPTQGSAADRTSPYSPAQGALAASSLRFDFRGGLLPPRISRAVPVDRGLHHHGEAPEAAGYTVPELARLARSSYPAQRCLAFQTLGRLLYRLGRNEFGGESEMSTGLWKCVEESHVLETLQAAASASGGHQGSKTYAIEAVWLWQKGGGRGAKESDEADRG